MGYGLGIDLGTTFTGAAVAKGGRTSMVSLGRQAVVEPSVVYAGVDKALRTGDAAVAAGGGEPHRLARGFKRRLGDPTPLVVGGAAYSPAALLAAQLKDVLTRVTTTLGGPPESIVLTCPAVWGPYRREHFDEVPRLAGVTGAVLVTEPEAAATHYAAERRLGDGELVAVYDLGGGTFDTTILRANNGGTEIVGTPEGIERLGGMDFDEALFAHVDAELGGALSALDPTDESAAGVLTAARLECVRAKESLSIEPDVIIRVGLPDGAREVMVTRLAFNDMIRPSVELTVEALHRTIASAGLTPRDLAAVLLAGGSSRIPLVDQVVSAAFGRPVRTGLHPKFTVALGAAAIAARGLRAPVPPPPPALRKRLRAKVLVPLAAVALVGVGIAVVASGGEPSGPPGVDAAVQPSRPGASLDKPAVVGSVTGFGKRPRGVAVTVDGSKVYVPGGASNSIAVVDRATRKVVRTISTPAPAQYAVVVRDKVYVTLDTPSNAVAVIDTTRDEITATIPAGHAMFAPGTDGYRVFIPDHDAGQVLAHSAGEPTAAPFANVPEGPRGVVVADGRLWVVSAEAGQVTALDAATRNVLGTVEVGEGAVSLAVAPDGETLYVVNNDAGTVLFVDADTYKVTDTVKVGGRPLAVATAPDGRHAYAVNNADGTVTVIDTLSAKVTATVPVGREPWSIAVTPDGAEAVVANADSLSVLRVGSER
ncbi:Hsp70 family protein [Actinokineospora auranticolor]|uniref:YVTN family beta-propeller protein n=1 Tax=Actinokineospora auranticolor TaxID=155976 RepID=A0A2S6H0C1_9PSEU|nr:Hsp70 family protein [Actinokineospora auranticolor]PPK70923.1 YVTN family beta-propeller protein [Actinokineospora auranticolor]